MALGCVAQSFLKAGLRSVAELPFATPCAKHSPRLAIGWAGSQRSCFLTCPSDRVGFDETAQQITIGPTLNTSCLRSMRRARLPSDTSASRTL